MAQTFPVAGRKIFMGGIFEPPTSPRLLTAGDFPAITANTWTPIIKWQSAGALGGDQATISTTYLNGEYDDVQMGTLARCRILSVSWMLIRARSRFMPQQEIGVFAHF